ncbi:MAG: pyridoxamine 5'-phosphate oxidase family protein [Chloroflexota bacterium]
MTLAAMNHPPPTQHQGPLTPRPSACAALESDPVAWLSSVRRDGSPHLVPVWFHWDGERVVAFSKPHARKV